MAEVTHTHTCRQARTHTQISAWSVSSLCLNGVFIGFHFVHSKSSQGSPCPLQVKLISALRLILGPCKRNWETALLVGWHWYQDTSCVYASPEIGCTFAAEEVIKTNFGWLRVLCPHWDFTVEQTSIGAPYRSSTPAKQQDNCHVHIPKVST